MTDVAHRAAENLRALAAHRAQHGGPHVDLMRRLRGVYFRSARDAVFSRHLETCLGEIARKPGDGERSEAEGILVLGPTGAGKSQLLEENIRRHVLFKGFMQGYDGCAGIGVRCAGSYTLRVLAVEILRATGYPVVSLRESIAWMEVRKRLQHLGVLLLFIDEVHNVVDTANTTDLRRILMSLKSVMNSAEWPMVLVLSGTPACEERLRTDRELVRRLRIMTLDGLDADDFPVMRTHIAHLCREAGLTIGDGLLREVVPRLAHAAGGAFGLTFRLALDAIEDALAGGAKELQLGNFSSSFRARTQASTDADPFSATQWSRVPPLLATSHGGDPKLVAVTASAARARQGLK